MSSIFSWQKNKNSSYQFFKILLSVWLPNCWICGWVIWRCKSLCRGWPTASNPRTCHQGCATSKLRTGMSARAEESTEHSTTFSRPNPTRSRCTPCQLTTKSLTLSRMARFQRTSMLISLNHLISKHIIVENEKLKLKKSNHLFKQSIKRK